MPAGVSFFAPGALRLPEGRGFQKMAELPNNIVVNPIGPPSAAPHSHRAPVAPSDCPGYPIAGALVADAFLCGKRRRARQTSLLA
jgi:hypothetical protein